MSKEIKMLIIDDEEDMCETLADIFQKKGYYIESATTAKEAIEKVKEKFFNVALIDIRLPDLEGTELLKLMKNIHKDMIAIMITGYASLQNSVDALNLGAYGYLIKPLEMEEVIAMVERGLEEQHKQQELRITEEKYRILSENAKSVIFAKDLKGSFEDLTKKKKIFSIVPEDEFVDRDLLLNNLYQNALDAKKEASDNIFILGRRRIGKSAVLTRLYDKLFFDQGVVIPFYYTFEGKELIGEKFADDYFTNFVLQYLAYKKKDALILDELTDLGMALDLALELKDKGLIHVLKCYLNAKKSHDLYMMLKIAICGPKIVSNTNQNPICVIVDDFQKILNITDVSGRLLNIIGIYHYGVEGNYCSHIVSGSEVSISNQLILTRGPLAEKFEIVVMDYLNHISALELGRTLAKKYELELPEEYNIYLAKYTMGLPYYINRILYSVHKSKEKVVNAEVLSNAIAQEITRGAIYKDLEVQLLKYIKSNKLSIVRSILYFASNYEDEPIQIEEIAEKLRVPKVVVKMTLSQMSMTDLIESREDIYYNIPDHIVRKFLKIQYFREVKKIPPMNLEYKEKVELLSLLRDSQKINKILVQSKMLQLIYSWNNRMVPGKFFGLSKTEKVKLPKFEKIFSTKIKEYQIDSLATYTEDQLNKAWICESKYKIRKITKPEIIKFNKACIEVQKNYGIDEITKWIFNAKGFTIHAIKAAKKLNVLTTDLENLNYLLKIFGLKKLELKE
ncbi:MAG: response regulator [Methanosarcinales archaeon]